MNGYKGKERRRGGVREGGAAPGALPTMSKSCAAAQGLGLWDVCERAEGGGRRRDEGEKVKKVSKVFHFGLGIG